MFLISYRNILLKTTDYFSFALQKTLQTVRENRGTRCQTRFPYLCWNEKCSDVCWTPENQKRNLWNIQWMKSINIQKTEINFCQDGSCCQIFRKIYSSLWNSAKNVGHLLWKKPFVTALKQERPELNVLPFKGNYVHTTEKISQGEWKFPWKLTELKNPLVFIFSSYLELFKDTGSNPQNKHSVLKSSLLTLL